jgi:hypothetical protein
VKAPQSLRTFIEPAKSITTRHLSSLSQAVRRHYELARWIVQLKWDTILQAVLVATGLCLNIGGCVLFPAVLHNRRKERAQLFLYAEQVMMKIMIELQMDKFNTYLIGLFGRFLKFYRMRHSLSQISVNGLTIAFLSMKLIFMSKNYFLKEVDTKLQFLCFVTDSIVTESSILCWICVDYLLLSWNYRHAYKKRAMGSLQIEEV